MEMQYVKAGFWIRFWAYLIDIILTGSLSGAIVSLYFLASGGADVSLAVFTLSGILSALVTYSYFILMTKLRRQTIGKQIFGLYVVHKDGFGSLSWKDVLFRELIGRFIHRSLFITNVLYLITAFHPEKRGIHDFIGDTIVAREPGEALEPVYKEEEPVLS
ncbi:RDD family protein [Alkalicoccus urumqiensis]|uniref:RDD family protein n=1 Tax=Alkalicoccus urumqiensis TaxID=1548213 RepID=A0A2P6MD83_ALKUR|nr:RDD family protein [Alkalicoccus urumqiensis]PRO64239.1 RDD family protein [Alkalicoccus urumqiensis]